MSVLSALVPLVMDPKGAEQLRPRCAECRFSFIWFSPGVGFGFRCCGRLGKDDIWPITAARAPGQDCGPEGLEWSFKP
jgi:hypothetical protein